MFVIGNLNLDRLACELSARMSAIKFGKFLIMPIIFLGLIS